MASSSRCYPPGSDRLDMAELLTPEAVLAVHAHRIAIAVEAERVATAARVQVEATASADGFPVQVWRRAMDLMNADPDAMAALERHTSVLLLAVRAGIEVEEVRVFEATSDQSPEIRNRRIRDEGFYAAVMGRGPDGGGYSSPDDQAVWNAGWRGFRQTLEAFEGVTRDDPEPGAFLDTRETRTVTASNDGADA